jgi:polyphosphate kinase
VIVELKARFDEARNIDWAKALEEAGVQVVYGVRGLKTHAKLCIVIRREPGGIRRYLHFGTGNYNEKTARLYTDISYMTCRPDLGADATSFFNAITGFSQPHAYQLIKAAPITLREGVLQMIDSEIERKRQGQKALVMAKMNSLADPLVIEKLYEASKAGVEVRLLVRGICCLRPGVPKLSEHIQVISVVDRLLEHSRVFYFHQGGDAKVYISSADWMPRNLDRRVELLVPVVDRACRRRLMKSIEVSFSDTVKARILQSDGTYKRVAKPRGRKKAIRSQAVLFERARREAEEAEDEARRMVFEPHRPRTGGKDN